jgi:hypothetical protein
MVRFRIAILVLLVNVVLGFIFLMRVREEQAPAPEAFATTNPLS